MDKGIVFCTSSGQNYAYIKESNHIITLNNDWIASLDEGVKTQSVFAVLEDMGQISNTESPVVVWPMDDRKYLDEMQNRLRAIVLEVTQECTLRCDYCIYSGNYEGARKHSKIYMTHGVVKQALDFYKAHSGGRSDAHVTLYGGEALLRFDIVQYAVAYAKELFRDKDLSIRLSSNGTTLNESVVAWLLENPEVALNITINGKSHDVYRKFPDGTGSLDVILRNVIRIRDNYPELWNRINFLANIVTVQELLDLRKFYQEILGKPPVLITGIIAEGGNETIRDILAEEDDETAKAIAKELYIQKMDPYVKPYYHGGVTSVCARRIENQAETVTQSSCCMPFTDCLYVSAEGKLGICEKVEFPSGFGNLVNGVNLRIAQNLLDNAMTIFNEKCNHCWCQRLCEVCFKDFQIKADGTLELPESICSRMRRYIENSMKLFCEIAEQNPELIEKIKTQWIRNQTI